MTVPGITVHHVDAITLCRHIQKDTNTTVLKVVAKAEGKSCILMSLFSDNDRNIPIELEVGREY